MDIEMKIQEKTAVFPVWDLKVESGIVPVLTDDKEDIQGAILACFIEKNTVPELPDVGVEWTGYLTGAISFGELDSQIRQSLSNAEKDEFRPEYQLEDDRLTLTVTKEL